MKRGDLNYDGSYVWDGYKFVTQAEWTLLLARQAALKAEPKR